MTENGKKLLRIPLMLLVDVLLFFLSLVVEMSLRPDPETGAVFTVLFGMVLFIVTVILTLSILHQVFLKGRERKRMGKQGWVLLMILQVLVSILLVYVSGKREIDAFYARPDHVGFAIPAMTMLLAGFLFLLTLIVFTICLYKIFRKTK